MLKHLLSLSICVSCSIFAVRIPLALRSCADHSDRDHFASAERLDCRISVIFRVNTCTARDTQVLAKKYGQSSNDECSWLKHNFKVRKQCATLPFFL